MQLDPITTSMALLYKLLQRFCQRGDICRSIYRTPTSLDKGRSLFSSSRCYVTYFYEVTVHTGNVFGAGTDSNVFLKIIGNNETSPEVRLPAKKNDLERGMVNKYCVTMDDVGEIRKLIVRHDSTGIGPAWYLEKIMIKGRTGKEYNFTCKQWLVKQQQEDAIILLKEDSLNGTQVNKVDGPQQERPSVFDVEITEEVDAGLKSVYEQIVKKKDSQ